LHLRPRVIESVLSKWRRCGVAAILAPSTNVMTCLWRTSSNARRKNVARDDGIM